MAVAKMQKVRILFHESVKDGLLEEIQRSGLLHISSFQESHAELPEGVSFGQESVLQEGETLLGEVEFALDYLKPFEEKKGTIERLATSRVEVDPKEYQQLLAEFNGPEVAQVCRQLERERVKLKAEMAEKQALKEQMDAWQCLDVPLEELIPTTNSEALMGVVPLGKFEVLSQSLSEEAEAFHLEHLGTPGNQEHCFVLYHKREREQVTKVLEEVEFTERRFPDRRGTPKSISSRLDKEMASLRRALQQLAGKSRKLVKHRPRLMVLAEHLADKLEQVRAEQHMVNTEKVFLSEGWIKKRDFRKLQERLEKTFDPISLAAIEPLPGEMPPVELENKSVPSSFEMIIDLYGRPKYTEVDPTPFLAPFFAIFFGLCLTDAGYGLTLTALSIFFLKKFRLGPGTHKLFRLLLWSGLATVLAGAFTGGYFGIDWSQFDPQSPLVRAVYAVKLFDPISDAMTFFKLAIALGVIHIFVGLALKMYAGIRDGAPVRSVLMQGPWLLADVGVGLFMLNFISPLGENLYKIGTYSLGAGLGGIFLFSGIGTKNPIVWVGKGLGGLYGVISIFSDILSYSRLVALGLATAVIAGVIDILGAMLLKIPFIGIILAIFLFLVAHLAYMVISCLGAFVHTARLNFVEFFSKFYEGGGEPFQPLRKRGKYVRWSAGS